MLYIIGSEESVGIYIICHRIQYSTKGGLWYGMVEVIAISI